MSGSGSSIVVSKGAHALVLGGGISGQGAALVLARHFDRVTIIERDALPAEPVPRMHAAQGAHAHVLLARGLQTLSRIVPQLPGWFDELGFPEGDLTYHTRVAYRGRWVPKARSNIAIRICTLPVAEQLLARAVAARPNITRLEQARIETFCVDERVRGVQVEREGHIDTIDADLVVDASGRSSLSSRWMSEAGHHVPEETVDPGVVYTSLWIETPPIADDWSVLAPLPAFPDDPNMGFLMRTAPRRALCSYISYGGQKPPHTYAELAERLGQLSVPHLRDIFAASTPSSEIVSFANTRNRRRWFARAPGFPDGLVVLGDAVCSLNPRYGQGMTAAAMAVEQLDGDLDTFHARHGHLRGFGRHFQTQLDRHLDVPWQIALLEDRMWVAHMAGQRPNLLESLIRYVSGRTLDTAMSDIDFYTRFMRVAQLIAPPKELMTPRTIGKILRGVRPLQRDTAPLTI
jgi:2-polyprenyl-6-methoxyphenol hydroxylase-like FAD-dependent oxidoreductase